jgi:UDP-N-acetyl-D-mannosaminuronic acid transferase (WecB/TagA/CpsF family)
MPMLETNTIWKQLLVMVFLTVSVVFAPFSASHASVCENVDGAHYVSAVAQKCGRKQSIYLVGGEVLLKTTESWNKT